MTGRATRIAAAFSYLALFGEFTSAAAAPAMTAPVSRQTYSISEFDAVRVDAPIDVAITTGKGVSATGTGDRETLDTLTLDISSRTLTIKIRQTISLGGSGGKTRAPTRLILTTNALRRATLVGSGNLTVDRLKGTFTEARLQGSGALTIAASETDRLSVGLQGAGTITLAGSAPDMTASVSGSGRLDTTALNVQRLRVSTEGSADVRVMANVEAHASAAGAGRIEVLGTAQCTVRKIGNANITCGGESY